jgi:hypothetical protein
MPRKCSYNFSTFCYVCGWLTFKSRRRNFTPLFKKCCELSFGCKVGDEDKSWASQISYVTCVRLFTGRLNGSSQIPFAVPMVWRETKGHWTDWYFNEHNRITFKSKQRVKYPDLPSAMRPVQNSEELPVPKPRDIWLLAMTTLILVKITDSKKGSMLIAIRHLTQVVPHMNPIY